MVICPLCEHAQDGGGECGVCGRRIGEASEPEDAVERLPDLEPTRLATDAAAAAARMEGLEPTRWELPGGPVLPEEPAAWVERTVREGVPAEEPAAAPEAERVGAALGGFIESTALAPRDAPARDPFALPVCRYCRTPAAPGELFCVRCGLKLASYSGEVSSPGGDVRRCRFCGASGPGETCPACGARLAEA